VASEAPSTERDGNRWALLYTTAPTLDPTAAHLPIGDEQALLYVGLSRARVHLVIVATGATMERVGCGAISKGA